MQNFRSKAATDIELCFFMKKKQKKQKKMKKKMKNLCLPVFHTSCDTFIPFYCMQLLFLPVLHLDVLRRQIETETEISLCMAIMLDHPWQSLYTQYGR